jgi:hypothetical protein
MKAYLIAALPPCALLSCALLAGCSGDGPRSNVAMGGAPAPGQSTAFLLDGDPAGNYGEAFMDADGNGFMLVGPDDSQAAQALYRFDTGSVQRAPGDIGGKVRLNQASAMPLHVSAVAPAQLAGSYTILLGGASADFRVDSDGRLTATGGACQLSGNVVAAGGVPGALPAALVISGCALAGNYAGYAIRAADYLPGAFRLVAENGKQVLDGFAITAR